MASLFREKKIATNVEFFMVTVTWVNLQHAPNCRATAFNHLIAMQLAKSPVFFWLQIYTFSTCLKFSLLLSCSTKLQKGFESKEVENH